MQRKPKTLVELLQWRASANGSQLAYKFVEDSEDSDLSITYAELDTRARAIAAELGDAGAAGERALLLYPPGLDFIAAYFGCLYAGVTAVPIYPPRLNRPMPRIQAIVRDADARFALTTAAILNGVEKRFAHEPLLEKLHWHYTELTTITGADDWQPTGVRADDLAFLQYTSGSTSAPKGVMLTHGNLMHNLEMIRQGFHLGDDERGVFWLPSYHDMGLIGGILEPMYIAGSAMLISPVAFLQRPYRWLRGITTFQATISGAPNFAFDLCVEKITPEQQAHIDLSSLKLCFTGAEPVRPGTMARFSDTFGKNGFHDRVLYPCYGLAEATLLVAGGDGPGEVTHKRLDREALKQNKAIVVAPDADGQDFIACGRALLDEQLLIVDPYSLEIQEEGQIGEIWVKGDHVAQGYWGKPGLSEETFSAYTSPGGDGPFLRTGDLGFLLNEELFITGRLKDLIIIRGKNHYPQDIEETFSNAHEAIEQLSTVAFSYDEDGEEKLAVVAETTRRHRRPDMEIVIPVLRRAVAEVHGLQVGTIVLVKPMSIPKTSSGKIKRQATKQQFLDGALKIVGEWSAKDDVPEQTQPPAVAPPVQSSDSRPILDWLIDHLTVRLKLPAGTIDPDEAFVTYGIDSAQAVSLTSDLEDYLGRALSPTLAWDYPTPRQLADYLAESGLPADLAGPETAAPGKPLPADPIAVIGLACRFPGASTPDAFWNLLTHGIDAIREVPADRFNVDLFYDPDPSVPGKLSTRWGGFLSQVDQFDPQFFGISPREASRMDPQQRLLMETSWEALESAGIAPNRLSGSSTGVFVGISSYDYSREQFQDLGQLDAYAGTGNAHSIAANRLSYALDLRGPSMAIDTACSSSLVSVHMACSSLRNGESELAIAAGVNLILSPELTVTFSQARMLSPDGRCKTFDSAADGYVRGEGCGVVILKRLSDAVRDGDPVFALVQGSAVNQDGRTNGLTAPNGPSQEAVIRKALNQAGITPYQVDYVEAHGTGTPLGDPIELHALRNVLGSGRQEDRPLLVGSVKTNIGHLEAAAGIAGFIKAVLALHRESIPPHLHFKELNPYISLDGADVRVPTENTAWHRGDRDRFAGVSSFGFGGTNAHIVLSEAPSPQALTSNSKLNRPYSLITLSGRTPEALADTARLYANTLLPPTADTAFTTQTGRKHFEFRLGVVANTPEGIHERLNEFLDVLPQTVPQVGKMGFIFTGQGAQYPGMTRELYDADPFYRSTLDTVSELAKPHLGLSIVDLIFSEDDRIHETRYAQPALFAMEYSIARMWQHWGLQPDYLLGHSIGEWAAACFAGVLGLEDALRLVVHRGRLMQSAPGVGGMLAVVASEADVAPVLPPYADNLSIAAVNGANSLTISGDLEALNTLAAEFETLGWTHRFLKVSHGFHSPLMEPVLEEFEGLLKDIQFNPPTIPIAVNADGQLRSKLDAAYWAAHIRNGIQFFSGIETLLDAGVDTFLEIGPKPTLSGLVRRILAAHEKQADLLATAHDKLHDWESVLNSLGRIYERGWDVDWDVFNQGFPADKVQLPTYPFQRERFWLESSGGLPAPSAPIHAGTRLPVSVPIFENRVGDVSQTTLLSLALAAGREVFDHDDCAVEEVRFDLPAPVSGAAAVQTVLTEVESDSALFSILARDGDAWVQLAAGKLSSGKISPAKETPRQENVTDKSPGKIHANGGAVVQKRKDSGSEIKAFLAEQSARALGIPVSKLPSDKALNLLGLDSLMAMEVRNAVEKHFDISVPIVNFLEGPTLNTLTGLVKERIELQQFSESIEAKDPAGNHPLTMGQQALWFLHELTGEDTSFNIAGAVKITGEFEPDSLQAALRSLLDTHPALTTTFKIEGGHPVQALNPQVGVPLVEVDATDWSQDRINLYLRKEAWRKFNLEIGPPLRVRVLRAADQANVATHIVLFSVDHIVADFWSVSLIIEHILQAYQAESKGQQLPMKSDGGIEFVDAARWLNQSLETPAAAEHLAYWRSQFENGLPVLNLPTDRPRPAMQTFQGETTYRRLSAELTQKIELLAQSNNTTMFNVLLAAFEALLYRYSGQDAFVVGSVMAGRDRSELEKLVGYLINPVALKASVDGKLTYLDLLHQTRQTVLEAFEHQSIPPALLAEKLELPRDHSRPPLFETMFIFQKAQVMGETGLSAFAIGLPDARLNMSGLDMQIYPLAGHPAQFDLTLMMAEVDESLMASMQFNTALFDEATVAQMLSHLEQLLMEITSDPGVQIASYQLVTEIENARMTAWNDAARRSFNLNHALSDLFVKQAAETPEKIAVRYEDQSLTFAELDARSNRLAAHLQHMGVGPGKLVGVYLHRTLQLPTALLAILKAGGAYVPLDPAFPEARINFMIEDAGLDIVLFDVEAADHFPENIQLVDVRIAGEGDLPFNAVQQDPENIAYVIYTSGSTGKPKGVQIPHRAVVNFMYAMQEQPGISRQDVLLAVTTLSFDISVLEIFLPLVTGAELVIAGEDSVRDGAALTKAIELTGATIMQATPSTWRLMIESGWQGSPGLKVLCGGEAMPGALAADLIPRCGELWNMYGPTETTIWSTVMKVESVSGTISIGAPIANTEIFILDDALNSQPRGIFGELGIAGSGLALGYLNRPELTAEKFVDLNGTRVYRTGDLARLLNDGSIDFAGRRDSQVKVRGYRIELGEIEILINQFGGIRQAVVDVYQSGTAEARLVGYVVLEDPQDTLPTPELRRALSRELPEYMVPALFVQLDALPLTPNGKVDRKALPTPEGERPRLETEYIAPRNEIEERLAAICAAVLDLEQVGVRDNFFDLGGTSLQATRLVFQVREEFGRQILLRRLFEEPTIEGLAAALEEAKHHAGRGYGILEPMPVEALTNEVRLDESIRSNGTGFAQVAPKSALLTGATGYLGAFLLRELLDATDAEVYVHVRAATKEQALDRVRKNLEDYELWNETLTERLIPVPGDLEKAFLGLAEDEFNALADEIDVIYHNGARVNFVQSYDGHKAANVQGTHEILRLATTGKLKSVHFVSTLSVFHTGDHDQEGAYFEAADLEQTGAPLGGYAQSKWVAEKLVQEAAARGVPAAIYRPGVISGHSETGAWNNADLIWGLARACFTLGKIPGLAGSVDVVPVDYVSKAIVHLSLNQLPDGRAYHLGNPGTYPFEEMVDLIQRLGLPVDKVPFDDWREALFRHSLEGASNDWNTFLPIIEEVEIEQIFMPRFDSANTLSGLEGSEITCPPVGPELLGHYLKFFNEVGFFSI